MLLNSQQIIERGLITGDLDPDQIQQVGIDLTVKEIKKVNGGSLLKDSKNIQPFTVFKPIIELQEDGSKKEFFLLAHLQCYSVTFNEECKIEPNTTGFIVHRSTLMRMGGFIKSAVFDPGYYSEGGISCALFTFENIKVEKGSKIAQMYFFENTPVDKDKLYNGSYQGSKNIK